MNKIIVRWGKKGNSIVEPLRPHFMMTFPISRIILLEGKYAMASTYYNWYAAPLHPPINTSPSYPPSCRYGGHFFGPENVGNFGTGITLIPPPPPLPPSPRICSMSKKYKGQIHRQISRFRWGRTPVSGWIQFQAILMTLNQFFDDPEGFVVHCFLAR